jgi:DNA-nicking Smr family endonuclease
LRLGFNHQPPKDVQNDYNNCEIEVNKKFNEAHKYSTQSQEAYRRGDGALAKQLSEEAKKSRADAAGLEKKKSKLVFMHNNTSGQVKPDEFNLHGQHVDEITEIIDDELVRRRDEGMTYVHIIVGQGHHSDNHDPKIKPAVEELCRQRGYVYRIEENKGRIYVELASQPNQPQETPQVPVDYGYAGQQQQPSGGYQGYYGQQQQAVGGYQGYSGQQQAAGGYQGNVRPGRKEDENSVCPCCIVM